MVFFLCKLCVGRTIWWIVYAGSRTIFERSPTNRTGFAELKSEFGGDRECYCQRPSQSALVPDPLEDAELVWMG